MAKPKGPTPGELDPVNKLSWEILETRTNPADGRLLFSVRWGRTLRTVTSLARYHGEERVYLDETERMEEIAVLIDSLSLEADADELDIVAAIEARRHAIETEYALKKEPREGPHPLVGRKSE